MEFSLLLAGLGQGRLWSFPSQKSRDSKAAGWEFHPKNEGWQRLFSTCVGWAEDLLALKCHHFSIIHCSDERIKPWPKLGWFSRGFALQGFTEQLKLGISTFQDYLNLERQTGPPPRGKDWHLRGLEGSVLVWRIPKYPKLEEARIQRILWEFKAFDIPDFLWNALMFWWNEGSRTGEEAVDVIF